MKRLHIIILLLTALTFSSFHTDVPSNNEFVPENESISENSAIKYHWFFIRMRIDEKLKQYFIVGNASYVQAGSLDDFRQKLWWGITHKQIAIGPFMTAEEAEVARMYYKTTKERIPEVENAPKTEVHWFLLSIKELKRANAYKLERMPARTASGTIDDFVDALFESMTFEHMVVGAFWNYDQAELAKTIYRESE
jgi:hypothetical protein